MVSYAQNLKRLTCPALVKRFWKRFKNLFFSLSPFFIITIIIIIIVTFFSFFVLPTTRPDRLGRPPDSSSSRRWPHDKECKGRWRRRRRRRGGRNIDPNNRVANRCGKLAGSAHGRVLTCRGPNKTKNAPKTICQSRRVELTWLVSRQRLLTDVHVPSVTSRGAPQCGWWGEFPREKKFPFQTNYMSPGREARKFKNCFTIMHS